MEPFLGQLMLFAGNFDPYNWALCNGQLLPIQAYQALYSIIGITYGGNGTTNFALPDLRGRVPSHYGQGPGLEYVPLGKAYGTETNKLENNQMPNHTHAATGTVGIGANDDVNGKTSDTPVGDYLGMTKDVLSYAASTNAKMGESDIDITIATTGSGNAFTNFQPSLGLNYCIALAGKWPERP